MKAYRIYKAKTLSFIKGVITGSLMVSNEPISFYGDIDVNSGVVVNKRHDLYGRSLKDKVLLIPHSRGSTVGPYILYSLSKRGLAPKAILSCETDTLLAVGCIISDIWYVHDVPRDLLNKRYDGITVKLTADNGTVILEVHNLKGDIF
ncbi:MAG TPA: DUF126 domain-containing protein [Euryarchaeota archaeon]|nr:DUF126 domain-containing protein [Euryarchaeota archaeon]